MIIGVTGNSGSGKSFVLTNVTLSCKYFIIDADKIGHKILQEKKCKEEVINFFGKEILEEDEISRKILGEIVFKDKEKLNVLTSITHKYIIKRILTLIAEKNDKYDIIFLDAPLLVESNLYKHCNYNILISAKYEDKVFRIMQRDNLEETLAKSRLNKQSSEKTLAKKCNFVICNDGTEDVLKRFEKIVSKLLENEV